ncbi:MAG: hypothetical protein ACR5LF_11990 [Symbiopectobacterium sp.]
MTFFQPLDMAANHGNRYEKLLAGGAQRIGAHYGHKVTDFGIVHGSHPCVEKQQRAHRKIGMREC